MCHSGCSQENNQGECRKSDCIFEEEFENDDYDEVEAYERQHNIGDYNEN